MSCGNCAFSYMDTRKKFGGLYKKTVYVCGVMDKVVDEFGSCKEYAEELNEAGYCSSSNGRNKNRKNEYL